MKTIKSIFILLPIVLVVLSACGTGTVQPTATPTLNPTPVVPTVDPITPTQTPEPTLTPTNTPTNTPEPTATPTLIPFKGFTDTFRFYRTWYDDGTTVFYFLNAGIDQPLYAKIDEHQLFCEYDTKTQSAMQCVSGDRIEIDSENPVSIEFFADKGFYQSVYQYEIKLPKALVPIYSNEFDCPDRGLNVQCEYEYRKYENLCTTSITCYDACGYYYSFDNIPAGLDAPWTPIGSCP
ncbi:MAG: hypothetical protein WBI14_08460 [Anaerolineaceae bacterium]